MAVAQLWPFFAVAGALAIAIGIGLWRGRTRGAEDEDGATVSRAERVRWLPSVRRATRRRAAGLTAIVLLGVVAAGASGVVAARPMSEQTIEPASASRDIMLCLDVSGSMSDVDKEVLDVFLDLIDGFEGERIGLTIFNASPAQIFPLTDDYDFIREHLQSIRDSFEFGDITPEHWIGTLDGPGASLIGDGLAACALRFDHADLDRSRSIILATDNQPAGAEVLDVQEAADYAGSQDIRVYALNPVQGQAEAADSLVAAAESTGGAAYALRGTTTVSSIVDDVQRQEASALTGEAEVVETDDPAAWIVLLLMTVLAAVAVMWRVRL
ncbi:VWA domain-containing protein [Microbacterium halophytorum]|uniref:VWA domain-containing protein n=1 Tax=Microbacterium halophytorum TaxID=2067568 RepID=UPI000CFADD2C|nr:VWA domain-containing protein [Microbacterium halophytorum]